VAAIDRYLHAGWNPMPVVDRFAFPAPLPRRLRVAFAADFHIRNSTPDAYMDAVCELLGGLDADMLLLGGDYGETKPAARRLFAALNRLSFPCGTYAVVGNNDVECFRDIGALRTAASMPILLNESVRASVGSKIIEIGGVDEMKHGSPDARGLFTKGANYRILLSHYPVVPDFGFGAKADLILSGHMHGGQINLFGLTSYSLGHEKNKAAHLAGLREYEGVKLFVSTGIGMSKLPVRIGAAPRVHLISLG
jgi:predicted MPP superfamily phosphohydrolase